MAGLSVPGATPPPDGRAWPAVPAATAPGEVPGSLPELRPDQAEAHLGSDRANRAILLAGTGAARFAVVATEKQLRRRMQAFNRQAGLRNAQP